MRWLHHVRTARSMQNMLGERKRGERAMIIGDFHPHPNFLLSFLHIRLTQQHRAVDCAAYAGYIHWRINARLHFVLAD